MENKVKVWLARDKKGYAFVHFGKPFKKEYGEWFSCAPNAYDEEFPSVKWEDDEPTEAYITLAEPQEQRKQEQPTPKQEIDWEQRRYEIAKDILVKKYLEVRQFNFKIEDDIRLAIGYADKIINELKKQSE